MEHENQKNQESSKFQVKSAIVSKALSEINSFNIESVKDLWLESKKMNTEMKQLQIESAERVFKYSSKLQLMREGLEKTFSERETGLSALYRNLDIAEKENDREKIMAILVQISGIIIKNPLDGFANMAKALEFGNDDILELDF